MSGNVRAPSATAAESGRGRKEASQINATSHPMDFLKNTWAKIQPWTGTIVVAGVVTVVIIYAVFKRGAGKKQLVG